MGTPEEAAHSGDKGWGFDGWVRRPLRVARLGPSSLASSTSPGRAHPPPLSRSCNGSFVPAYALSQDQRADMVSIMRRRPPRDLAITSISVIANAVRTKSQMGEVGAPCFWVRCRQLRTLPRRRVLRRRAMAEFPQQVERWPAAAPPTQPFFVAVAGGPDACIYIAAWHDA